MVCILKQDHPLRVQFGPGLVVHAARQDMYGGFYRYRYTSSESELVPKRKIVCIPCKNRYSLKEQGLFADNYLVPNTTPITCKLCLKRLGMSEEKASPVRYVIIDNETGEYYKHARYSCSWVQDMLDATLYKMRHPAEQHTKRRFWEDCEGNEISRDEYQKLVKKGKKVNTTYKKSPRYDVLTVTINLNVER